MITSTNNPQMKNLAQLLKKSKERRNQKCFVVEGTKMCMEAPRLWLRQIYVSKSYLQKEEHRQTLMDYPYEVVEDRVFAAVSDTMTPQGILAVVEIPRYELEELLHGNQTQLLILESIQDPGNLGTMIRTGEGAGMTGIIMNKTTADLFNPKTIRSTMGSIYRVPYLIAENLPETIRLIKKQGVSLYAAHLKGTCAYDEKDYTKACGFLIGNEGNGLTDEIANLADAYIKIPMEGQVESLNAAISASLLLYECHRQRRRRT